MRNMTYPVMTLMMSFLLSWTYGIPSTVGASVENLQLRVST